MSVAAGSVLAANLDAWPSGLPRPCADLDRVRVEWGEPWPGLFVRDGGQWVTLHSRRDPLRDAERWLGDGHLTSGSTLFVIGLGFGYLLDVLERQGWAGRVVAFEPEPALVEACLERRDWRPWLASGRLTILLGPSYEGLDETIPSLDPDRPEPAVLTNPVLARVCPDGVALATETAVRAWFGARANQEARRQNGGRYLLNTLRNARAIAGGGDVTALVGRFTGMPAIVVAAGPSLDANLRDILQYRDRALVIAVDTALRPLLTAGVEPDLVVAVDPTEANARHLTDLPVCPHTCLVAEGSLDPEALTHFAGRTFFFHVSDHQPWPWFRSLGITRGPLRAWGSVLTTAFDLALVLGCDPIVFAGADLAFTDGRPYARNTTYEEDWRREQAWGRTLAETWALRVDAWPETWVPGVGGAPARTAPHLRAFRDWIVREAARAGRTVVNGTGAGILLGESIRSEGLDAALGALPVVAESAREGVVRAYGPGPIDVAAFDPTRCPDSVRAAWREIVGSDMDDGRLLALIGEPTGCRRAETPLVADEWPSPEAQSPGAPGPETAGADVVPGHVVAFDNADRGAALLAKLEAAWALVPAGERLHLVDRTGVPGGSAVQRVLFAFLDGHPDVTSWHGRWFDPRSELSWVQSRPAGEAVVAKDLDKCAPQHADVASRLTGLLVEQMQPRSVLDIGCGVGHWLDAFRAHGVADVAGVEDPAFLAATDTTLRPGAEPRDLAQFSPVRRVDLCLCLGVVHRVPQATAEAVVAACTQASDTVVFSAPAPGIGLPGYVNERPWVVWHRLFLSHGFTLCDELRPLVEERWGRYPSPYDLLVVYRRAATTPVAAPSDPVGAALLAAWQRIDEQVLQGFWFARALAAVPPVVAKPLPRLRYVRFEIAPERMDAGPQPGTRTFRFRALGTSVALAADGVDAPMVAEDAAPLSLADGGDWSRPGQFSVDAQAIVFSSRDGSDPRHNGRTYTVRLPAHVAWLEHQPGATVLEREL